MQIVQTLNDFIKILYTPSTENICLGDFLLIQEASQRFLGQVVELSDDKFDDSKNLAQIKLTHSINDAGEIIDFNNHLPSKQCDILYANSREILDFVNEGKKTIKFGEDFKFAKPFEFNIDFFENNPLIFCDTIKEHNFIVKNFAKKLSNFRKTILFDYTGALDIEGAQKFRATVDFKLPLDFHSLDYIWEKGLSNATLETQAVCEEIFNEVKSYSKVAKDKFIPFNKFIKVIKKQHQATPIKELLVLKNRLQSYQQEEIFANAKSEFTKIFEEIGKKNITIIDLSNLKILWHKDFTEFILRNIKINSFIFARLNENNFDYDMLSLFYDRNSKYTVIPSISHCFAKLPVISEYCPNYIIFPTMILKKDFGHINNAICTMSSGTVMLYGKDSRGFMFLVKNIGKEKEEEAQAAKKPVTKVTFEGDVIKNMRVKDKLTQLSQKKIKEIEQEVDQFISSGIKFAKEEETEEFEQPEMLQEPQIEETPQEAEFELHFTPVEEIQDIEETYERIVESKSVQPERTAAEQDFRKDFQIEEIISEEELDLIDAQFGAQDYPIKETNDIFEQIIEPQAAISQEKEYGYAQDELEQGILEEQKIEEEIPVKQTAQKEISEEESETLQEEQIKVLIQEQQQEAFEDFSLEDLAQESIETTFEETVDVTAESEKSAIESMEIPAAAELAQAIQKKSAVAEYIEEIPEIPIYMPETPVVQTGEVKFAENDIVIHDKYGEGKVLQVVEYSDKVLLQIEFERIGKRLLDPVVAGLKKIRA